MTTPKKSPRKGNVCEYSKIRNMAVSVDGKIYQAYETGCDWVTKIRSGKCPFCGKRIKVKP